MTGSVCGCVGVCVSTYQCASCYVWHAGTIFRLPFSSMKHFERLGFQVLCVPRTSFITFVSFPVFSPFIVLSLTLIFTWQPSAVCGCAAWKAPSFICLQYHGGKRLAVCKTVIGYCKFSALLTYKWILCSAFEVIVVEKYSVSSFSRLTYQTGNANNVQCWVSSNLIMSIDFYLDVCVAWGDSYISFLYVPLCLHVSTELESWNLLQWWRQQTHAHTQQCKGQTMLDKGERALACCHTEVGTHSVAWAQQPTSLSCCRESWACVCVCVFTPATSRLCCLLLLSAVSLYTQLLVTQMFDFSLL